MVSEPSHCMLISVLYCHETKLWKIADFGLTTEATSRAAVTTRYSRGTTGYRAPELLTTSQFTNKVDMWALGSTIYELTMGRKAFSDDFAVESYSDSRSALQLSISLVPESHLRYLSDWVYEMLERNPEQRPSISIILRLVKSYCMLLDLQSLEELELVPPYDQWKELVGETGFFSDLVG
jgi:serine/threonine protein kinase